MEEEESDHLWEVGRKQRNGYGEKWRREIQSKTAQERILSIDKLLLV